MYCVWLSLSLSALQVPKTIDNDVAFIDKSFGFDTAVAEARKVECEGGREGMERGRERWIEGGRDGSREGEMDRGRERWIEGGRDG